MRRSQTLLHWIALGLAAVWTGTLSVGGAGSLPPRLWATSQEGFPDMNASAYGAGMYVAAGKHGVLYTSPNGTTWTQRMNPAAAARDILGMAYAGGQFVAVGVGWFQLPVPVILTSPNGVTWTERVAPPGTRSLFAVAYGNGLYVAVGNGGHIITSFNAIAWTARTSGTNQRLRGVAWAGGVFVAVGDNRTVLTSSDGVTWTPQTAPIGMGFSLRGVAHDGTQFIAVSSEQAIMTSPDGETWTQEIVPNTIPGQDFFGVAAGGGTTVVVGNNRIYTSLDGVLWELRSEGPPVPSNGVGRFHRTIVYGPSGFVTLGLEGSVFTSADGTSWGSVTDPRSREWNDVAFGNDRFCAVGWSGSIASSPDGVVFTNRSGTVSENLLGVAIAWGEGPERFVAVSPSNSRIYASSDCVGFEPRPGINGSLNDVVYGDEDDLFAAVGWEETGPGTGLWVPVVVTSADGLAWTEQVTGVPADGQRYFYHIAYGAGRFVATGQDGTGAGLLYTSEDGIGWTPRASPFDNFEFIDEVLYANGLFVAAGERIWTSPDGINWTLRLGYDSAFRVFLALGFGDGVFAAVNDFGAIVASADGESWEEHSAVSSREQRGIAFSGDLHRFVVVGESIILRTDDPVLNFSPASYDVTEGTLTQNVTVTRMGSLSGAVSVTYATADGTAFGGQDYTGKSGTLALAAGKSSATIAVPILNDTFDEKPEETFTLSLSNPSPGVFLGPADVAEVNIHDNDEGGTIELGIESLKAAEGKGPVTVKVPVTRTGPAPLAGGVGVTFTTFSGTAFPGEDYTEVTKTVTFPAGVASVTAEITILPDAVDENDETFGVRILAPSEGADLGEQTTAIVTIGDDDSGGAFQFVAPTYAGTEGVGNGLLLVKVQRTGGLAAAAVDLSIAGGSASPGDDYTLATGSILFAPGQTTATQTLTILNDLLGEGPETVTLRLENAAGGASVGAPSTTVVTINDNEPAVQFLLSAQSVVESAGSVKVTVSRTAGPGPVSVDYGVTGGNASSPADFGPASGTIAFGPTELSRVLTIPIANDAIGEGPETFVLGLSNAAGAYVGARGSDTVTITDNEPVVQFALSAQTVLESAGSVKVTVSRTAGPGPVSVEYGVTGGTATLGSDFGPASGNIAFGPTELSRVLTIPIANDGEGEGPETFVLGLSNPAGASIGARGSDTVTITDNEPAVQFLLSAQSVAESAGSVKVTVSRTAGPGPVSVDYGVTGGNASSPADFGPVSGTIAFGSTELSRILTIPIANDAIGEGPEMFVLGLSNPVGASIGARGTDTVTITDNEPSVKLSLASYKAVSEAVATSIVSFQVQRVGSPSAQFTVDYRVADGTATAGQDYHPIQGSMSFPPGWMSHTVNVPLLDDDIAEPNETIRVILENPAGAFLAAPAEALLNVTSNDDPGSLVLEPASSSVVEPETGASFPVALKVKRTGKAPLSRIDVNVMLTPLASTATSGADFDFTPGTLSFTAAETEKTFNLQILGDATGCEGLETVALSIQGLGALPPKVSAGQAVIGIADRGITFLGPLSASGMLSTTGPNGTCTWHDTWTGTVLLNLSCPNGAGNSATLRTTRILDQGVPSGPGLSCPSASEQHLFSIPLEDDGTNFFGGLANGVSVALDGSRSGDTASGNLTFSTAGPTTGDSAGTFTAQKE